MSTVTTNQFKNGNHIEVEGTVFKILEFQHVKPGKGGAFVRTKLRRVSDGNVIERTFRAGEKFRSVRTESRRMQFLYADGEEVHLMDTESYEQIAIPAQAVSEALRWCVPSSEVDALIDEHAHGWSVQRIQPLERSIMRVALLEMLHPELVPAEEPIPAEGAIEEAVESAKTFCSSEAPGFVNGVLGAVLRELRENAQIP